MTPEITIATLSLFIFGIAYAVIVRRLRQRTHGHHGQTAWLVVVGVGVVVGMRTGRNSHITCDCGRLWTHAVEIQVVNSNGTEIAETLRLCDACYAEFVAMEAAYA